MPAAGRHRCAVKALNWVAGLSAAALVNIAACVVCWLSWNSFSSWWSAAGGWERLAAVAGIAIAGVLVEGVALLAAGVAAYFSARR